MEIIFRFAVIPADVILPKPINVSGHDENIFKNRTGMQKAVICVYYAGLKPQLERNRFDAQEIEELVIENEQRI